GEANRGPGAAHDPRQWPRFHARNRQIRIGTGRLRGNRNGGTRARAWWRVHGASRARPRRRCIGPHPTSREKPMSDQIRILIADDHPVVRKGLRMAVEEDAGLAIVAEAADGETALALIEKLLPQVAVLDVDMPKLDGFGVAREIRRRQ